MYGYLSTQFKTNDSRIIRRLILVNAVLLIGFMTLLFFMFFNYFILHKEVIAFLNGLFALMAVAIFLDLRYNRNLDRAGYLTIGGFFAFVLLFVYHNHNESFGLIWTQVLPVMVVGIIGSKRGFLINLVYFAIIFCLAYEGIGVWNNGSWDLISFFRLVFASFVMLMMVTVFDIALERSNEMLEHQSVTDALTQLYNRRKISDVIHVEAERAARYKTPVSLILFDVDDFKQINDSLGHQGGDKVLVKLADTIRNALRSSDSIGRWGGEEFIVVCPETTVDEAVQTAEKLRQIIHDLEHDIQISCSFGVSGFDPDQDSVDSFINRADLAMYRAKSGGKNRVSL